jgi:hypothetical protein
VVPPSDRYDGLDLFRSVSMFSVVLLHVHVLSGGGRGDVILLLRDFAFPGLIMGSFFVIAVAFDRKPFWSFRDVVRARVMRLLVPSLVWSYLYWIGWWMIRPLLLGQAPLLPPLSLALTSYMHFWFLHLVFVITVAWAPLLGWVARGRLRRGPVVAACAALAVIYPIVIEPWLRAAIGPGTYQSLPAGAYPAPDWRQCVELMAPFLAFIPAGVAIGLAHRTIRRWYASRAFRAATVLAAVAALVVHVSPVHGMLTRESYAVAVFLTILRPIRPRPYTVARTLARWSFVIYILHFAGAIVFSSALRWSGIAVSEVTSLLGTILVVGVSLATGVILRRLLPVDWLLPVVAVAPAQTTTVPPAVKAA